MENTDAVFDALANDHRRDLLIGLLDEDYQVVAPLSKGSLEMCGANEALLAEYLSGDLEIEDADKAAIREHHVHLPKLAECGLIEWEVGSAVATRGPNYDDVRPLLELLAEGRSDLVEEAHGPIYQR